MELSEEHDRQPYGPCLLHYLGQHLGWGWPERRRIGHNRVLPARAGRMEGRTVHAYAAIRALLHDGEPLRPPRCCRVVDALVAAWKPVARRQPASPSALQLADIGAAGTARRTARRSWNATCIAGFAQPAVYPAFRHLCSPLSSGPCSLPCSPPYFELGSQSNSEGKKGVSAAALFFVTLFWRLGQSSFFPERSFQL